MMTDTERIVAAIESLSGKADRIVDLLEAMARSDIAARSNDDARLRGVSQFVNDFLHVKEQVSFIAERVKPKKLKAVTG